MSPHLQTDLDTFEGLLRHALQSADNFLQTLSERPVAVLPKSRRKRGLPTTGTGGRQALETFLTEYSSELSGSAGPRYFGFVTGGATPAAVAGDWLVSVFDQNLSNTGDSIATEVERETLAMLQELLNLPASFTGSFVTGATVSNFVGLALARQWVGRQYGINVAEVGSSSLPTLQVLSATPHSSVYKVLSMLGLGRQALNLVPTLQEREAIDVVQLEMALKDLHGQPVVVVANAGTVNTTDFDDLRAIGQLKRQYAFWLHVDAAFGAFASCSPVYAHLLYGIEHADSVAVDAHKWLNVPYDAAMQFVRPEHLALQIEIFQNSASYLSAATLSDPNFNHLTPENSRRFRALPTWCTLVAYGREGYREIVERNCQLARQLSDRINTSTQFALLVPTALNIVCFTMTPTTGPISASTVARLLDRLREDGRAYFTATVYRGRPGLRAAFCNWRTQAHDVELAWQALEDAAAGIEADGGKHSLAS